MIKRVTSIQAWNGTADCLNCSIRSSALFSGLTEDDFDLIHEPIEQQTLEPGSVLYKAGDPGRHLYTVRSGLLKMVQYLPDGYQRIVRLGRSTDVLGLEMLVGQHYQHEVIALNTSELCRYPKEAVLHLSQANPELHKDLMARWHKALSEADAWITKLSTGSSKKRMANLLLRLPDADDSTKCYLLSREDIGSILSMTLETASRTISDFKRTGLISEIRHNYIELDVPALKAVVEG
ncbi:MAG: Crp/Fnr family transcriptional regulator [Gammaproteobacteria bacterium]|nr:Crp/Fnr family transcriptional regulator [Gammaproteobacteria bacterium]